jgi:hypothetical protein
MVEDHDDKKLFRINKVEDVELQNPDSPLSADGMPAQGERKRFAPRQTLKQRC